MKTLEMPNFIDQKCSQVIQSAMGELIMANQLPASEVADFADSLVFDERSNICFAYDPRDVEKRRLQGLIVSAEQCNEMNCFDCAYTAGACLWNPEILQCILPSKKVNVTGFR